MTASFKNILVPADFSINTEVAIKKALEICDEDSVVHLVYVQNYLPTLLPIPEKILLEGFSNRIVKKAISDLCKWKMKIHAEKPKIVVPLWVTEDLSIQKAIIDRANYTKADLLVIGKESNHSWLPFLNSVIPSVLAKETGSAVLTVKPGSLHSSIKNIVVPITDPIFQS